MEPKFLRLRGFIGIRKGLGAEEISLDLSMIKGLVALSGPNGRGKSTVLENLHPYRILASRKGALKHHVELRDSLKEFHFDFMGDSYRTVVKIDCDSDRGEAFIYKNGNEKSETTGKSSEYDQYIESLFGSKELFFNSIFCAQGSTKLSDMRTGDLKKLFSEFLRLDRLVEWEGISKEAHNIYGAKVHHVEGEISEFQKKVARKGEVKTDLKEKQKAIEKAEAEIKALNKALVKQGDELAREKESLVKQDQVAKRIRELQADKERVEKDLEKDRESTDNRINRIKEKVSEIDNDVEKCSKLLIEAETIRKAAAKHKEVSAQHEREVKKYDGLSDEYIREKSVFETHDKELIRLQSLHDSLHTDEGLVSLKEKLKSCEEKVKTLENIDPECKSQTCSFIVGARVAEREIPSLQEMIKKRKSDLEKEQKAVQGTIETVEAQVEKLSDAFARRKLNLDMVKNAVNDLEKHRDNLKEMSEKLPEVEGAESRRTELVKKSNELESDGVEILRSFKERKRVKNDHIDQIQKKIKELVADKDDEIRPRITGFESTIKELQTDKERVEKNLSYNKVVTGNLEKELALIDEYEKKLKDHTERKALFTSEAAEWNYIKQECSKDGLRALEIDSVAPAISGYANDLLASSFGPGQTLNLLTQDETGKETLDIMVILEDGEETLLENRSGGEQVWGLKALHLAMTRVTKEKYGKNFLTALVDEEDGALDVENALNFVTLYRKFMTAGEFNAVFFISHKSECVSMADHQLMFEESCITIQ